MTAVAGCLAFALLAGTGGLAPATAHADKFPEDVTFFNAQYQAMAKACAQKLWEASKDGKSRGFHEFAVEFADRALEFDPDHKEAREYLGWVRKGKVWVVDSDARVQRQNLRDAKESEASFRKRLDKWRESMKSVDRFIADAYAKVGAACAAKGFPEQARKAYERAILIDRDCEAARKGLGFSKVGTVWLDEKQAEAVKRAATGEWIAEQSPLEKGLGVPLNKMRSVHFRVEDDAAKEAQPDAIKALETLYCYFLADVGADPTKDVFGGRQAELCVVSTKALWDRWVDQFSNAKDKEWTKGSNTYRDVKDLHAGTLRSETAEHVDTRDPLLHHATHFLEWHVWKLRAHAWLEEGLAYHYTVKVQGTTRTHCLAKLPAGPYGNQKEIGGEKDWTISENWRAWLLQMVKKKDDVALRTIMATQLATLELPASVKSWSVLSWLMEERHDKVLALLAALRDTDEKQEDAFQRIFGEGIESVEEAWRAHVLRAY